MSQADRRVFEQALLGCFVLVLSVASLWSQSPTGRVAGRTLDPSGAAAPEIAVSLEEEASGRRFEAVADAQGRFTFTALRPGTYLLSAEASEWAAPRRIVTVEVGRTTSVDIALGLREVRGEVDVTEAAPVTDPHSSSVGVSIARESVERLPLNQREFFRLALLAEGVSPAAPGSELQEQNDSGLNVFGGREAANNYLLDGVDNNDAYINRLVVSPPLDSIREFRLHASGYQAEFGRSGGAQVNAVSRSGSNQLHLSLYEYLRNEALDARNFFDPADKPMYRRNQFGASVGGPIVANRAFFFAGFEGTRIKDAVTRTARVPTAAELSGDFSASPFPVIDPFTQQAFEGNRIPESRLSPIALELAKAWPAPNRADPTQNLVATPVGDGLRNQAYGRADFYAGEADSLYLRYNFSHNRGLSPFGDVDRGTPGFGSFTLDRGRNLVVSETHVFGPRTLAETRFGYNRLEREVTHENAGQDIAGRLGISGISSDPLFSGFPKLNVAGYDSLGDESALPIVRDDETFQLVGSVTAVRGRHVWKMGGEARWVRIDGIQGLYGRGELNFLGALSQHPLGDFVLGLPTYGIQTTIDNPFRQRTVSLNGFVQDDWRVTPRLTLNLGVRYEYNQPAYDADDRFALYDAQLNELVEPATSRLGRAGYAVDKNNFAPRAGLSYRPAEDWVVRAAYGVFYNMAVLEANSGLYFNPPYFELRVYAPSETRLLTLADPFPTGAGAAPPASVNAIDPHFRTGYAQHWNVGVERRLPGDVLLRASYVGTKGTKLLRRRDLNQPTPGAGSVESRRPIDGFANVVQFESAASSVYHGLALRAERRFGDGLAFSAAYTLSKSIDEQSAFLDSDGDQGFPQNSHNFSAERGLSNFDQRHRVVVTADYQLPLQGVAFRNWRLLAIAAYGSGRPFTPALTADNSNTGNGGGGIFGQDRPNLLSDPNDGPDTPEQFFNTSVFGVPAAGTFGNAGRNTVIGPSTASIDLAVARVFQLGERARLEARAEAFNVTNRANFELPRRFADQPTFGRITAAGAARQMQLGLRLTF